MILTKEENDPLKKLKESTSYNGNIYKVEVPWKDDKPLFRRNPIALVCGIKEMYLHVEIEERDRFYFFFPLFIHFAT